MRVAIVTDSNSGITQEQGRQAGIYVVPMPFMMAGETYFEDISLTQKSFYERLAEGADISTSQPSPASLIDLWNELLKDHDSVIHIPMSSGLSSSCETAHALAADFGGKVLVVNNQRISVTQRQSVLEAKAMADQGMSAEEIKRVLEETAFDSTIYITVDTLEYLKKGGRITPAAALLGTFLKIKPVLTIQGEKLDAFAKARTMKQAKSMMVTALEFKKELMELFPKAGDIYVDHLSLSVSCHIGPGALAVACTKKLSL